VGGRGRGRRHARRWAGADEGGQVGAGEGKRGQ